MLSIDNETNIKVGVSEELIETNAPANVPFIIGSFWILNLYQCVEFAII